MNAEAWKKVYAYFMVHTLGGALFKLFCLNFTENNCKPTSEVHWFRWHTNLLDIFLFELPQDISKSRKKSVQIFRHKEFQDFLLSIYEGDRLDFYEINCSAGLNVLFVMFVLTQQQDSFWRKNLLKPWSQRTAEKILNLVSSLTVQKKLSWLLHLLKQAPRGL